MGGGGDSNIDCVCSMDARSELMPNGLVVVAIVMSCDSRNEAESTQAHARLMKVGEVEVRQGKDAAAILFG